MVCARSRAKERAEAETGPWTAALQAELGGVSDDRDALRAQVADLQQQAAGINCANPRVMQARLPLGSERPCAPQALTCSRACPSQGAA